MNKKKTVKLVVEEAKKILVKKDAEIDVLRSDLKKAKGEMNIAVKLPDVKVPDVNIPDTFAIKNFPDVQKVFVENQKEIPTETSIKNFPEVQKVHVENPPSQSVHVLNLKDLHIETKEVSFPDVQGVKVLNFPEPAIEKTEDKPVSWVPAIVMHSVKTIMESISKRLDKGITIRLADEERYKPQPVIMVDRRGVPIDMNRSSSIMIPMPGGGRTSGTPPATIISSGRKTVSIPGTAEKLVSVVTVSRKVVVTAPSGNNDAVYIGGSNVSAVSGSQQGLILNPTGSVEIDIDDVSKVWIDAVVAGEGVTFTYVR